MRAVARDDTATTPHASGREAADGPDLETRLLGLPGIGAMKAKTLLAILGKRFGVRPPGWETVAPTWPTLGDVDSPEALARYQAGKRAYKAAMRAAAGTCRRGRRRPRCTVVAHATTRSDAHGRPHPAGL